MIENLIKTSIVALGMFDGVHIGHRALLKRASAFAHERGERAIAYTFSCHPMKLVTGVAPDMLLTNEERYDRVCAQGIDEVVADSFTPELCDLPPLEFLAWLHSRLHFTGLVVGYNYTFGKNGAGKPEALRQQGKLCGYTVDVIPPIMYAGAPVSSTRIRNAILHGEMTATSAMLGEPYSITATVCAQKHIGSKIGYPTANITELGGKVLPRMGVYVTRVITSLGAYYAVTNVGNNPTIAQGNPITIESHLLDFSSTLYGQIVRVEFLRFIREQQVFSSLDALSHRIACDVLAAREYLNAHSTQQAL